MDVLFWSGGKDSYLALQFYKQEHGLDHLKLLTTCDEQEQIVPLQQVEVKRIKEQSAHLGLDLLLVPLPDSPPNEVYLERVCGKLEEAGADRLVFGDWKLEDIREWREEEFGGRGYECLFPIWKKSIHDLLPVLILQPVEVKISAVEEEYRKYLKVGEPYNPDLVMQLPDEIDPMGENGEFHTEVVFRDLKDEVV
ncbi:MAG: hypothetical protein R3211_07900 [Balneolaceae bacterium]|nr:hypothetical protein [Balneolaceae bacterium]